MEIPYRIINIVTNKFQDNPELLIKDAAVQVLSGYNFAMSVTEHHVRCISTFTYKQGDNALLNLELSCFFEIEEKAFEGLKDGDKRVIPVEFLRYMATISVGTARGVIHSKTEGTSLSSVVLPPINLVEAIKEPFVMKETNS